MLEHYLLCFDDECSLADECLHRLATRSRRQKKRESWSKAYNWFLVKAIIYKEIAAKYGK